MTKPRGLYPILADAVMAAERFAPAAVILADAGVEVLQLRLKSLDDRAAHALHRRVADALRQARFDGWLIINDRADLAAALAAAVGPAPFAVGVHLGQRDLPPDAARALLGPTAPIGLSTHSLAQVAAAADAPVDYLGFGPVFATATKANPDPTTGLPRLAEACAQSDHPIVAIGGITQASAADVAQAGASSAAVISDLFSGGLPSLRARVVAFQKALR